MRVYRFLTIVFALIIGICSPGLIPAKAGPPQQGESFDAEYVQRATVQIMQVYTNPLGQTIISCVGTGTIVSADGLILTNAHVVLPVSGCRSDRLAIAITKRLGEPPVATYYAEVVVSNIGWDLAVLQIARTLEGRPVDKASLALPFVELGDSEDVRLDDTIVVVGYASPEREVGANAVSRIIRATVSGFTAEARVGDRAWTKTRTALPGSMTGGGVYTTSGKLIGVPTVEPASRGLPGAEAPDCVRIQDSNGDGRVDDQDLCIPSSGLINAMRPSRLARGLILAAKVGIAPAPQPAQVAPEPASGPPRFSRLLFATGVDLAGMPSSVVYRVPTGITRLYLFFDYENMVDGMIYELRVTRNGIIDPTFSLAPATWSGGQRGLWYIGSAAQVWPNGDYEFALFIEGSRTASATMTVGVAPGQEPEFANIFFGVLDENNQLVSAGNILPVANTINAEFVFNNMAPGTAWRQVWYNDGLIISQGDGQWTGSANGKQAVNASAPPEKPLQPGHYRLELYIGDRLSATADFIMAGGQVDFAPEVFTNLTFTSELKDGRPGGVVGVTFPSAITDLYALFDWRDIAPGTPVTWRWTVDDNLLFEVTERWGSESNGAGAWFRLKATGQIPDGSYRLELLIANVVKLSGTARVGLGQLPVGIFTVSQGARLQGRIIDAETKRGIQGVSVIVLKPEFDVDDFTWQMSEVFDLAYTDTDGQFALPKPLLRGETYSVIVVARGYLPTSTDGLEVDVSEAAQRTIELRLELNRD